MTRTAWCRPRVKDWSHLAVFIAPQLLQWYWYVSLVGLICPGCISCVCYDNNRNSTVVSRPLRPWLGWCRYDSNTDGTTSVRDVTRHSLQPSRSHIRCYGDGADAFVATVTGRTYSSWPWWGFHRDRDGADEFIATWQWWRTDHVRTSVVGRDNISIAIVTGMFWHAWCIYRNYDEIMHTSRHKNDASIMIVTGITLPSRLW